MRPLNYLSGSGLVSALLAFNAGAISFQDIDVINQTMNAANSSVVGSFDIRVGDGGSGDIWGYNPATETITGGTVWFFFDNPTFGSKRVSITLSGEDFISPNTSLSLGTVVFGELISGELYLNLDATGHASYTVTRTSGEFVFINAELYAESGPRSQIPGVPGVPDSGTTVAFLGLSIIGLGLFSKKVKGHFA